MRKGSPSATVNAASAVAAGGERHHRPSGRLGLDGCDPEVFLAREQESAAACVELTQLGLWHVTQELDVAPGARLERPAVTPVAHDLERQAKACERFHRE